MEHPLPPTARSLATGPGRGPSSTALAPPGNAAVCAAVQTVQA